MTLNELFERIPTMKSVVYAQGKTIIVYEDESCEHIRMIKPTFDKLEKKLDEDLLLRVKHRSKKKIKSIELKINKDDIDYELDQKVLALYKQNFSYSEISKELNIKLWRVTEIVKRLVADGVVKKNIILGKYDRFIIENYNKLTNKEIIEKTGITYKRLSSRKNVLVKRGLLKTDTEKPRTRNTVDLYATKSCELYNFKNYCERNNLNIDNFVKIRDVNSEGFKYFFLKKKVQE